MSLPVTYYAIQIYAAMMLLTWKEEKSEHYVPILTATAAASLAAGILLDLLSARSGSGRFFSFLFLRFYLVLLILVAGWFLALERRREHFLFYCVAALLLQNGTFDIHAILYELLGIETDSVLENLLHVTVFLLVYAAFYKLVLIQFQRYRECVIMRKMTVLITLIVFVINQVYEIGVGINGGDVTVPFRVNQCVSAFLCLSLQFGVLWTDIFRTENERTEELLEKERDLHQLSEENRNLINAKCHDLKQQIAAIRQMSEKSEQTKGLEELEDAVMFYEHMFKTGSDALDLILADKSYICETSNIQLICVAEGGALSFMEDTDIYTLFGNALDNAIECLLGEDEARRRILLNVTRRSAFVSIHMENCCTHEVVFRDGLPQTSKKDTDYHGYGMKSIRFLADKYDGVLSVSQKEDLFILNILIPIPG